MQQANRNKCI
ncbi:hypothetical protein L0E72_01810 [Staphylococcus aureus]|nr:hypothetical protein [Staphylococcus aureus]